jgi:hypothetical protein
MSTVYVSRLDRDGPMVAGWPNGRSDYPQPRVAPMPGEALPPPTTHEAPGVDPHETFGDFATTAFIRRQLDAPAEPWEPFATATAAEHDTGCDGRTADAHAPDQHVARCTQCGQTVQTAGGGL